MQGFTPEEALALSLNIDRSKAEYNTLVSELKSRNCTRIFPSYTSLQKAASECCLPAWDVIVTQSGVRLKLQSLLDLTVRRLLQLHEKSLLGGCR